MNLYEALGVAKDATSAQIRKAYRSLAKAHHPDAGGDPDKFHAIALANEVLQDEAKRARYDETGEVPGASNPDGEALSIIGALVDEMTQDIVRKDGLEHEDLIGRLVKKVDEQIKALLSHRKEAEKFADKAAKLRARFKAKTGPDYIGKMLDAKVDACKAAIKQAADQLGHFERARKILKDATFEIEPRPKPDEKTALELTQLNILQEQMQSRIWRTT